MIRRKNGARSNAARPQLQIWADEVEALIGRLVEGSDTWELHVVIEPVEADLYRGRISFRRDEERCDTAGILLEETQEAVIEQAAKLPGSVLHQLLVSARG